MCFNFFFVFLILIFEIFINPSEAPSLWSTIDYSVCRHQVSDYAAKRHAEIARLYLSKLNLSSTILETSSYRAFAMCRNVQHLNLSGCRFLNDEQAVILLEGFRALLTLDLSKTSITDTTIRALSKYGTNLQVLNLAYCTNFTTKGLLYLSGGEGCRMLKFLDMVRNHNWILYLTKSIFINNN